MKIHLLVGLVILAQTASASFSQTPEANQAAQASQSDDRVDKGNAEASAAVRHFSRGMAMDYALMIYNARLDKVTNRPQVTTQISMFRAGKQVFAGRTNPLDTPLVVSAAFFADGTEDGDQCSLDAIKAVREHYQAMRKGQEGGKQ